MRPKPTSGGWRGHPNSLAALAAHRERTLFGGPGRKLCKCGMIVVKGLEVCRRHGGGWIARQRQIERGLHNRSRHAADKGLVRRLLWDGMLPLDLLRNPAFKAVLDASSAGVGWKHAGRTNAELARFRLGNALVIQMVMGWIELVEHKNMDVWHAATAQAKKAGMLPD